MKLMNYFGVIAISFSPLSFGQDSQLEVNENQSLERALSPCGPANIDSWIECVGYDDYRLLWNVHGTVDDHVLSAFHSIFLCP